MPWGAPPTVDSILNSQENSYTDDTRGIYFLLGLFAQGNDYGYEIFFTHLRIYMALYRFFYHGCAYIDAKEPPVSYSLLYTYVCTYMYVCTIQHVTHSLFLLSFKLLHTPLQTFLSLLTVLAWTSNGDGVKLKRKG